MPRKKSFKIKTCKMLPFLAWQSVCVAPFLKEWLVNRKISN